MKILVIADNFPCEKHPQRGLFVKKFTDLLSKDHDVYIVSPRIFLKHTFLSSKVANVYYPLLFSFSNKSLFGVYPFQFLNRFFMNRLIRKISKHVSKAPPDFIYSHFISSGVIAEGISKKINRPYIINIGESTLNNYKNLAPSLIQRVIQGATKILTVSQKNKDLILSRFQYPEENIRYIPNGIDSSLFRRLDKEDCRRSLGFSANDKIVIFVGLFKHRKGPDRVIEAVKRLENVKLILVGMGEPIPEDPCIIFNDFVSPEKLPLFLNAADMFILPTLNEGMPNATLEAMACGLPIITSDLDFNREFLTHESSALLVDPMSIPDLSTAIQRLFDSPELHQKLAQAAYDQSQNYTMSLRYERINHLFKSLMPPC